MTDTPDLRSSIVVWAIWALTLTSLLAFIVHDGRNIPFEEDWMMVAPMTGHEPHLASWLWSQNSEHRLPLPRLVNLALLRATGDFRATMLFDALILAAVTAGMILHARRLRGGRTRLEDVFFPLLLLHLGNWDNLVWAWQIQYVLPTVLTCVILLTIVGQSSAAVSSGTLIGALALVCLPLSGANGLIVTPPLAAWFAYQAWAGKDGPRLANRRLVPASAAVLSLVLCAVYFVGFDSSPWNAASPGPTTALATFGKFVALGLGPLADYSWPLFGVLAAGTLVCAGAALLWALPRRDEDRIRLVGLLAFLAAALILAALVGWGRDRTHAYPIRAAGGTGNVRSLLRYPSLRAAPLAKLRPRSAGATGDARLPAEHPPRTQTTGVVRRGIRFVRAGPGGRCFRAGACAAAPRIHAALGRADDGGGAAPAP
jgi:hypothetical protein